MNKPKIAFYWCASCGGCEEAVVDLAEDILAISAAVDIVFWPVAMDFKYEDVEKLADEELAVTLINGAIRTSEQEQIAKLLRKKSKLIIANGSCAHLGGIVGLANFFKQKDIINTVYNDLSSVNANNNFPQTECVQDGHVLSLPEFSRTVKSLNQIINVDYYLPGCPTTPQLLKNALTALLTNNLPVKGTVLAEQKSLCDSCSRKDSKPEKIEFSQFKRIYEIEVDWEKCFLGQGIICLGMVTRGGCKDRCIKANMPCRGCFGPLDNVVDFGAKALSAIASLINSNDPEQIKKIADSIPDPAGLFYRYSLASSILKEKVNKDE